MERAVKLGALRELLDRRGLPAIALTGTDGVAWATGGVTNRIEAGNPASAAWVVVTPDAAYVITTNVELPRLQAEAALDEFEVRGVDWFEADGLVQLAAEVAGVPAARIGGLGIDVADDLVDLRFALLPSEQDRLAALAADATLALETAVRQWTPGELDVTLQARVAGGLEAVGAFGACLIVGGDERVERFRHPLADSKAMNRLVMAVVVAERHGLHVAATRFGSAGSLPDSVRAVRSAAAIVERAGLDATRAGARAGDGRSALEEACAEVGHAGEWRDHYQGGPVGYRQREFEIVPTQVESRWYSTPIAAGTAVAWNPSIAGGGKCEDTYLVGEDTLLRLTDTGAWPLEDDRPAVLDVMTGEAA
ncbi:MAG: M24 family metallopeptidase [Gaiellaceae bacterium]